MQPNTVYVCYSSGALDMLYDVASWFSGSAEVRITYTDGHQRWLNKSALFFWEIGPGITQDQA